jgi:hypothetical protein
MSEPISQLYNSTNEIHEVLQPSTMHAYMRRDFAEYKQTKRRLDCCSKCRQWDWQVIALIRNHLKSWKFELDEICPGFMAGYGASLGAYTAHERRNMTHKIISDFAAHIVTEFKEKQQEMPHGETIARLRLRVYAIKYEILQNWKKMDTKIGMLEVVQIYQLHFTLRDTVQELYEKACDDPSESTLYWHMDYLEHKSVPIGPDEAGNWWYANAREGVYLLVIAVWAKDHCRLDQGP